MANSFSGTTNKRGVINYINIFIPENKTLSLLFNDAISVNAPKFVGLTTYCGMLTRCQAATAR
jgi:hypothetical protein